MRDGDHWYGDNTDGAGIVRDLTRNLGVALAGRDVLVLGAGGAARGILVPLLAEQPRSARRSPIARMAKADELAARFAACGRVARRRAAALAGQQFDIVINATSAGLGAKVRWPWPHRSFAPGSLRLRHDLRRRTDRRSCAGRARKAPRARADGLGMLIEQAAESFFSGAACGPTRAPVFALLGRRRR